ncbi:MAG: hypothetical protein JNM74_08840 [Myxococcales bacterium]|nr:hypothetical protein [Myxococcales bacterium]
MARSRIFGSESGCGTKRISDVGSSLGGSVGLDHGSVARSLSSVSLGSAPRGVVGISPGGFASGFGTSLRA